MSATATSCRCRELSRGDTTGALRRLKGTRPSNGGQTISIHADELQPGDVVAYGGHWRLITRVECGEGWAWPVACDDAGWAMALGHDLIVVHPPSDDLNGAEGDVAQRDRALR
jgi:hypothetical protein